MRDDRYRRLLRDSMVDALSLIEDLPEDVPSGPFLDAAPEFAMQLYEFRANRHMMRQHHQDKARYDEENSTDPDDRDRM